MEENELLQGELAEKLEKEYERYKENLLTKTKEEILERNYETTVKQEIVDILSYSDLDDCEIKVLLEEDDILTEFYQDWLDCDTPLYASMEYCVQDSVDIVLRCYNKTQKAKGNEEKEI